MSGTMSKSARSQSFPRSQKPLVARSEGFFAKLKRRLRIGSKKSYSIGEALDGVSGSGHYMSRSSMALNGTQPQTTDPIVYSDMGHNIACSIEPSSPNGNSIVRVRAESRPSSKVKTDLPKTPKLYSSSSEDLVENKFVLPEENAVDLDDNVFVGPSTASSVNHNVPEILEEPGYETLEDIRKQIKELDKKSENNPNPSEKSDIAVKTDFQKDDSASGNIRGQMSKTSLDSGLGSPEQGTQSPNLDSECDSSESITSTSGVKVGTKTVQSFHTVQRTPQVEIINGTDEDIYANAQIQMRKKSVKKSQSEPSNMAVGNAPINATQIADYASNTCGSAHADRDSANPPPLPDRQYSMYVDQNPPSAETSVCGGVPPPLPIRKYSTSELDESGISVEMGSRDGNGNFPEPARSDVPLTEACVIQTNGVQGLYTCKCGKSKSSCSCNTYNNRCKNLLQEDTGARSKLSSTNKSDVDNVDQNLTEKSVAAEGNIVRGRSRLGSRRNDKTVVEVRFGSVKLKEEVPEASGSSSGTKPAADSSASKPGNITAAVVVSETVVLSQEEVCICKCGPADSGCTLCAGKVHVVAQGEQHAGTKDTVCSDSKPNLTSKQTTPEKSSSSSQQTRTLNSPFSNSSDKTSAKSSGSVTTSSVSSTSVTVHSVTPRSVAAHSVTATSSTVVNSLRTNSPISHSVVQRTVEPGSAIKAKNTATTTTSATSVSVTTTTGSASATGASGSAASAGAMGGIPLVSSSAHPSADQILPGARLLPGASVAGASQSLNGMQQAKQTEADNDVPPPTTSRTIRCNSLDPDVLFRDDEPIHMSLKEVFAQGTVESSIALAERISRRRSRLQINSEDILAFQESMQQLKECGWYWGPLSSTDAEHKLANKPNGSYLVRDSANENYILSITFKSSGKVHHTRIEHFKGKFSFWSQPESHGKNTIKEFIEQAMENSRNGQFKYFLRAQGPGMPPVPMYLLYPVSRFRTMRSLMHMCRFTILQLVRRDHVDCLPIPLRIKNYLKEHQYYAENIDDDADDVVGFDKNDNQTMTHL